MGSKVISQEKLSDTLTLSKCTDGFWLWDDVYRGNLAIRSRTREAALLECIRYYQRRLPEVYNKLSSLQSKVDSFLVQFEDDSDD